MIAASCAISFILEGGAQVLAGIWGGILCGKPPRHWRILMEKERPIILVRSLEQGIFG